MARTTLLLCIATFTFAATCSCHVWYSSRNSSPPPAPTTSQYTEGRSSLGKLERSFSITLEFVVSVGTRFMVVETTVSSGEGVYTPFKGERPDTQARAPLVIAEES